LSVQAALIGLGNMGAAMADRALDAGHDLAVYNRSPEPARRFAERGAKVCASLAEAAAHGGIVLTMLANDAALRAVAHGPDSLIASLPPAGLHVVMGTHSVEVVRELAASHAAAGQFLVSAPVLGRPEAVTAGKLGIVVAGPAEAVARCRPLLEAIGARIFAAGDEPGGAAGVKVANNFLLGCAIEAMGEAFALTEKLGVDRQLFYEVITAGLFAAPAYSVYGRIIADADFANPGFTARLGLKDAELALAVGSLAGVPLPSANVWRDHLLSAIARGEGELDWAVMAREQARASGLA
jgi:3-hydroxyisobutyrate dehydrogenase-like beta-hydroxyacid dehydrogenase